MRRHVRHLLLTAVLTLGCNGALVTPDTFDAGIDIAGDEPVVDAGVDQGSPDVPPDGGPDAPADAAACGCALSSDGWTLTMSLSCLCSVYGCAGSKSACGMNRVSYPSCGLVVDTTSTFGGPNLRVYDEFGNLVGEQYSSDTSDYFCPSDRSLHAARVRAGQFPDPSCAAEPCTCADGGSVCAPAMDAGAGDAPPADGGSGDAGSDASTSCAGDPFTGDNGTPGGLCSDSEFAAATCVSGNWKCPGTKIPVSQCGCFPGGGCT
jgi:hypothetical protein